MARGAIVTDVGATLLAANFAAGVGVPIDRVSVADPGVGARFVPTTALTAANVGAYSFTDIDLEAGDLVAAMRDVVIAVQDEDPTHNYTAYLIIFWSGATPFAAVGDDTTPLLVKTTATNALATLGLTFDNTNAITSVSFTEGSLALATLTQTAAGTSNTLAVTVLGLRTEMQGTARFPTAIAASVTDLNTVTDDGVYSVTGTILAAMSNRPTGATGASLLRVTSGKQELIDGNGALFVRQGTGSWQQLGAAARVTVFTANGTWTKPPFLQYVRVEAIGNALPGQWSNSGNGEIALGGSGGGFARGWLAASELGATEAVTVPQANAPAAAAVTTGGALQAASFGTHVVTPTTPRSAGQDAVDGIFAGGRGGGARGLINSAYGGGAGGTAERNFSHDGGISHDNGNGGRGNGTSGNTLNGEDGHTPGGGGGGAWTQSRTDLRGGAGARGEVRVFEFF